jgi:AraC-like DNA-binding protein
MVEIDLDERVYPPNTIVTVVASLGREGVTESRALDGAGLSPRALRSPETRVSLSQRLRVYRNAVKWSRDPQFAYRTGQKVHVSTYGAYGFAILSSTSFRQGIDFAVRYQSLATPLVNISFCEEAGRGIWSLLPIAHPSIDSALSRFLTELHVSILVSLHRDSMGPSFAPLEIRLRFDCPGEAETYGAVFGCPVLFGQKENNIIFDSAWLERDAPLGNEIAHSEAVKACDDLSRRLQQRAGLTARVRQLLTVSRVGPMSSAAVAKRLHMAERTLRRKLAQEHTSLRKLVSELRMETAVKYLRDTDLSIREIAHALDFSDDASFRHAFTRRMKVAPQKFRDRLKGRPERQASAA